MKSSARIIRGGRLLAATLLLLTPALAAPEEKETQYEVELLVFEQRFPQYLGDELLPDDLPANEMVGSSVPIEPPGNGASRLAAIAEQIEHDPQYRILVHERWLQRSEPKTEAKPRRIRGVGPDSAVDGSVRFYTTRFLHVEANLTLRVDSRDYYLNELRRLRLNELHYFDHPRFGMLARISQPDKGKPVR